MMDPLPPSMALPEAAHKRLTDTFNMSTTSAPEQLKPLSNNSNNTRNNLIRHVLRPICNRSLFISFTKCMNMQIAHNKQRVDRCNCLAIAAISPVRNSAPAITIQMSY
jgi:histone deacetylase complex regulatory component SIN3